VVALLDRHRVNYKEWGTGTSYSLSELIRRLNSEEIALVEENDGRLILRMKVVIVHLHYRGAGGHLVLHEKGQYFYESRKTLHRNVEGIAETAKKDETLIETGQRVLNEELGQSQPKFRDPKNYPQLITDRSRTELDREEGSRKWPGLTVRFNRTHLMTTVGDGLYLASYMETILDRTTGQPLKTTTFTWLPESEVSHL
jgi:hypothetical protein